MLATIAAMWAEELGVPEVRPEDGFFELGGHSLTALRVVYRVRDEFSVDLSLRDLMAAATLTDFVSTVAAARETPARPKVALVGRRGTR
ncbi:MULTISPECIES: phosphopantetheine-binding protein [unclassified Amycolatopsis]|uniref:phosphopantetheine-binding protein n=1 Tax=unclassified Amycolatopsis TaxID=2618356 RepID=UPI001FF65802|nr:phosphopantetheine-binding protein [Amycolatopsis sp. FBCC-B4732]UOX91008.1 phosphopantetheine-binding protein [Amycolatopsis sp. FBCC-B4732]